MGRKHELIEGKKYDLKGLALQGDHSATFTGLRTYRGIEKATFTKEFGKESLATTYIEPYHLTIKGDQVTVGPNAATFLEIYSEDQKIYGELKVKMGDVAN